MSTCLPFVDALTRPRLDTVTSQAECRRFESRLPLHSPKSLAGRAMAPRGSIGTNLDAELSSEQRRQIEQLLVADDRAAETFDPDESVQPCA